MNILVVHPDRTLLERIARPLRRAGIASARTCHLVAAVVYIQQLAPEVIVAGGYDAARRADYSELLARVLAPQHAELRPWGHDLVLLHHRLVPPREVHHIAELLAEELSYKTKKAAPLPPFS